MAAKKRTKETSDPIASLAATVLRQLRAGDILVGVPMLGDALVCISKANLGSLAASCLSQDTTKGKRGSPAVARHLALRDLVKR